MTAMSRIMQMDEEAAWAAFEARDRSRDGAFVVAVRTTHIYCKPSCPARRPRRENIRFYADGAAARVAGYRPCMRCRPDDVGRDALAIGQALGLIGQADEALSLAALAEAVGYAPHHFQRLFTRHVGISPAAYARALRSGRLTGALAGEGRVTDAIYEAGYSGPGRFYEDAGERLGMTPSAWRNGGAGVTIRWAIVPTHMGPMLLAATAKGICRLSFDEDEAELRCRFPRATIEPGGDAMRDLVSGALAAVDHPATMPDLPLDVAGTAFQEAVWRELRRIPPGETRSYAQIAAAVGKPGAVRAAGSANGANNVAVLIPCHRVIRSDGTLGGYAYGLERKQALLDRERDG